MKKQLQVPVIPDEIMMHKIYLVRGYKVMLDRDLAELYDVETKRLNEQVKRNPNRFPEDFMFQLTTEEWENLKSQNATSSWGGTRKLPQAFTEHGVLMLSSVLNSEKAIGVNIQIMRIFSRIRKVWEDHTELRAVIEAIMKKTERHSEHITVIFQYLDALLKQQEKMPPRKTIGFIPGKSI